MVLHAGHSTGAALDPVAPDLKMWTVAPDMPNLYTGAYPTTLSKMNVQVFPPDDNMPWKPEYVMSSYIERWVNAKKNKKQKKKKTGATVVTYRYALVKVFTTKKQM